MEPSRSRSQSRSRSRSRSRSSRRAPEPKGKAKPKPKSKPNPRCTAQQIRDWIGGEYQTHYKNNDEGKPAFRLDVFNRTGQVLLTDLAKDALDRDNRLFSKEEWKAASKKILGEDPLNL